MVKYNFDASKVKPRDNNSERYPPLPDGKYLVEVHDSIRKQNDKKTGHYIRMVFRVTDGEHRGRLLSDILNVDNPNPTAVEIANETMSSICHAAGVLKFSDTEKLHGQELTVLVTIDPDNEQYNRITAYGPPEDYGDDNAGAEPQPKEKKAKKGKKGKKGKKAAGGGAPDSAPWE